MLQPGRRQVAAGYVIYGSSTMLVYTTGQGVHGFTLDPSIGEFLLSHPNIRIPDEGRYLSVNDSYEQEWDEPTQAAHAPLSRPRGRRRPLNVRYVGSLVADFHRNLLGGGVFCYPVNTQVAERQAAAAVRGQSARVHLRAGGRRGVRRRRSASSTSQPTELHQRTPLFIGSKRDVDLASQTLRASSELVGAELTALTRMTAVTRVTVGDAAVRRPHRSPSILPSCPTPRQPLRPAHRARLPSGAPLDYERDLGDPGEFPFTRGVQPTMYRGRLWTMRQYAGFGTARADQRALPPAARHGPDRAVRRVRPADADGHRLRLAARARRGRPRRASRSTRSRTCTPCSTASRSTRCPRA